MFPNRPTAALRGALAALVMTSAACAPRVTVRTTETPGANLAAYRTFRVLPPPARRPDAPALPAGDPMLTNSISNQQLRQDLRQAFESRGYVADRQNPDFLVAYYAGTKQKLDTAYWDPGPWPGPWRYSYRGFRGRWAWPYYGWAPAVASVQEYTQGTVIVDVIDARTNELAWRGQGVAEVSNDPQKYMQQIDRAVDDVLKKFPTVGATVSQTR